jgi:hypothetical protein
MDDNDEEYVCPEKHTIKIITIRDVIKSVPERWARTYDNRCDPITPTGGRDAVMPAEIQRRLDALDMATCTKQAVDDAIGNESWTELKCDLCDLQSPLVVRVGAEPDYDVRWIDLCPMCLAKANDVMTKAIT